MKLKKCPHCARHVEKESGDCPHCGQPLSLRRERTKEPEPIFREMNKFIIVAIVFFLLLIPLAWVLSPG